MSSQSLQPPMSSQSPPPPMSSQSPPPPQQPPPLPKPKQQHQRDFLTHLESYLSKRDGIDKLLKISRYTSKLILSTSIAQSNPTLSTRLKSFESSLGLSRKAFRLGKFVQDLNALRALTPPPRVKPTRDPHSNIDLDLLLSLIAYGGEGLYYFVEQFVWLAKSGLIDSKRWRFLQKVSAWSEFVGYFGSVAMKVRDLRVIVENEECLKSSVEISRLRGVGCEEEEERLRKVREKKVMKRLSIIQDLADSVMALDDILDGKGPFSKPVFMASAGLLSAIISAHKNWKSC